MVLKQCIGFLDTSSLWKNEQFGIQQFVFPKIDLNSFEPKPILTNIRLGHQMEYVFKQLLEYSSDYEVIIHNLPIKDGKQTIGEIDFILRETKTQQLIHVELTYKFYIINPEISESIHQLIGPNKRDMFFTKMEKIKNKQFSLLHSRQGINALQKMGLDHEKIMHQTCYKAQLFFPYRFKTIDLGLLDKDCIVGYWLKFDDFDSFEFKQYTYFIPNKPQWVIMPHKDVQWRSHFKIRIEINQRMRKENAPMVWVRKSETKFEKFFIVWW